MSRELWDSFPDKTAVLEQPQYLQSYPATYLGSTLTPRSHDLRQCDHMT